ncbi:MAG TPA: patatin-like phospholipase family protein [Rhizomicrobium sp.]|nr:patatin-like phospholipase family protein [Rhizomicrobium sp.]
MLARFAAAATLGVLLTACVGSRPDGAMCPSVQSDTSAYGSALSALPMRSDVPARSQVNILVLSGGGAWGAYGAGFLNGWSARYPQLGEPRPQFDVVTGVSTGAIIAPFALLGPDYDGRIADAFRGVSSDTLFRQRSVLGLPFWNSLKDPEPMRKEIAAALDDDAIVHLARAAAEHRSLWVGAVNFDSGAFTEFDLSQIAAAEPPDDARKAMVQRILAASAIPGYFPPRFIGGCMYMDGAVRENLFLAQIGDAIRSAMGGRTDRPAVTNIYAIINGPMAPHPHLTDNTLVGVGVRGFEIAADQIQLASLREVYDYAKAHGYHFAWTSADDVIARPGEPPSADRCEAPETTTAQFTAVFTACLFDAGKRKAMAAPAPWRSNRP